jgi:hypothetical protein
LSTYTPQATHSLLVELGSQLGGITPISRRISGIMTYRGMWQTVPLLASNPDYDLVYAHLSVPHGPDLFEPRSGGLTWMNFSKIGYFGNLILADRLLGNIRRAMEDTGEWQRSAVLITADHEWRHVRLYDNLRVRKIPFLLKMPGQNEPVVYEPSFSPMTVTKDLLLAVLSGTVTDAAAVVDWLNKTIAAAPVKPQENPIN